MNPTTLYLGFAGIALGLVVSSTYYYARSVTHSWRLEVGLGLTAAALALYVLGTMYELDKHRLDQTGHFLLYLPALAITILARGFVLWHVRRKRDDATKDRKR